MFLTGFQTGGRLAHRAERGRPSGSVRLASRPFSDMLRSAEGFARRRPYSGHSERPEIAMLHMIMATHTLSSVQRLSDADLLSEVTRLVARERHETAQLIASLAGAGREAALSRSRVLVAFHLLHTGAPPVRARGVWANRGRSGRQAVPDSSRAAGRRRDHADRRRPAGAAFDRGESSRAVRRCASQVQARRRASGCTAAPATGRRIKRPQTAGSEATGESDARARSGAGSSARAAGSCRRVSSGTAGRRPAGTRAVQGSVHGVARDVREAATCAGSAAAFSSQWRPCRNLRSGVDAVAGRAGQDEAGGSVTSAGSTAIVSAIPTHTSGCQARGVDAGCCPVRVRRDEGAMH